MNLKFLPVFILLCLSTKFSFGQNDTLAIEKQSNFRTENAFKASPYDPLAPSKAAFYSAVLPGLGQAYNGSYWKIPIVYGGLGFTMYLVFQNDKEYQRYRDAYKSRLAGFENDEFQGILEDESLISAQKQFRKNKELAILATIGLYILNIVDANVDAHLSQFDVSEDLSLKPNFEPNVISGRIDYGLSLNFKFN